MGIIKKIFGKEKPHSQQKIRQNNKPNEPRRLPPLHTDEMVARSLESAAPNPRPPIHGTPQLPSTQKRKPTAEESAFQRRPLENALNIEEANEENVRFQWGAAPESAIIRFVAGNVDNVEMGFPNDPGFLRNMLPEELREKAESNIGSSMEWNYADAFFSMRVNDWNTRLHPTENVKKERRYKTRTHGHLVELRFDEILAVLALKTAHSHLFVRLIRECISGPTYLNKLKEHTGNPLVVGDLLCTLHGAVACATGAYEDHPVKHMQVGTWLFHNYFENIKIIHHVQQHGASKSSSLDRFKGINARALADLGDRLKNVDDDSKDVTYVRVTQEIGVYVAMTYQAALQYAEEKGAGAKNKAMIVTVCADLITLGVTGVVASHFPPILAIIPAALTFVSTHIVPTFVPKTDFKSQFLHIRAASRSASERAITAPMENGRHPTLYEMQQRRFYNDIFYSAWDMVADACAGTIG